MKKILTTATAFILPLLPCHALPTEIKPTPDWLEDATSYQFTPQSFMDSDGDCMGDLKGIIGKLDYTKELGCDAAWMNPSFVSAFMDTGYDVIDYCKVDPRNGTNEDLESLFNEARARGIRICLDLVAGHTSDQHEWFLKSCKKEPPYSDRYIWSNDPNSKDNGYVFDGPPRYQYFMKNFFECQPAINYGFAMPENPWEQSVDSPAARASREELFRIMDFWMSRGAAGFRVDMAASLIKRDLDFVETRKLWSEIRGRLQQKYPQAVLISEWGNPEETVRAGFMLDFMIHFGVNGCPSLFFNDQGVFQLKNCYSSPEGNGSPVEFVENYMNHIKSVASQGYISIPSANHDIQRPRSGARNTEEQLKVVMAILLTLKSIPFIYYGDELAMRFVDDLPNKEGSSLSAMDDLHGNPLGNRAGARTAMQWTKALNSGFSSAPADSPYLPIDPQETDNNVEEQRQDPGSLFNLTKTLTSLRKKNEALGNLGVINFVYAKRKHLSFGAIPEIRRRGFSGRDQPKWQ